MSPFSAYVGTMLAGETVREVPGEGRGGREGGGGGGRGGLGEVDFFFFFLKIVN